MNIDSRDHDTMNITCAVYNLVDDTLETNHYRYIPLQQLTIWFWEYFIYHFIHSIKSFRLVSSCTTICFDQFIIFSITQLLVDKGLSWYFGMYSMKGSWALKIKMGQISEKKTSKFQVSLTVSSNQGSATWCRNWKRWHLSKNALQ